MASVTSGTVTIGGTVFGAVEADIVLDDGTSWHYAGYYADCGAGDAPRQPSRSGHRYRSRFRQRHSPALHKATSPWLTAG